MKQVRNNKGFTLIEILIVVVLLGLIATFAFKHYGNAYSNVSTQQAATKVAADETEISESATRYSMEQSAQATGISGAATTLTVKQSVSGTQYLTGVPVPPTGTSGTYTWDSSTYTNTWGTASADAVVTIDVTSTQVCQQINQQFAGAVANATPPASVSGTLDMQCFGPAGGPYTALKTVYIN